MKVVYFLGRFHVVVLHLPIGIVLVTIAVEALSVRNRFENLRSLTPVLWLASAVTAASTALLGLMHAQEGIAGDSVSAHRAYGLAFVAVVATVCCLQRWRPGVYRRLQLPLAASVLILVTLTGHFGGNITHGSAYLAEYAPEPIRRLAGLSSPRPAVSELAQADVYLDLVQPIFKARCSGCHSDDRKKGGLSLSRLSKVVAGGRDGAVVIPGNAQASDLYRRVTLPSDHKDFMPAEGKAPLTQGETRVIEWWIAAGLPSGKTVGQMPRPTDAVRQAMLEVAGLAGKAATRADAIAPLRAATPQRPAAAPETLEELRSLGYVIRPIAIDSPMLDVAFTKGQAITLPVLESLLSIKGQVAQLNLRAAGLDDSDMRVIGELSELEHLRLELNGITDAGVERLATLNRLRSLNLYGTRVTDASLVTLAKLSSLQHAYLFGTKVSADAQATAHQISHP